MIGQFFAIAKRSILRAIRRPTNLIFPIVFPLAILAINTEGLHAAVDLPGFPTNNLVEFAVALTFMQGALFSAINTATDVATDVESGFLRRLSLAPVSRGVLLAGETAGTIATATTQNLCFLVGFLIAGGRVQSGLTGALVLIALAVLFGIALAAVATAIAVRSGSSEAVQGLFPVFFVFLLLSSALMPRDLVSAQWFKDVATINPVSYMVEALRSLIIDGWDVKALIRGLAVATAIACLFGAASLRMLAPSTTARRETVST